MTLQTEARRLAAPGLLARGKELAKSGEVYGAIDAFKQALAWLLQARCDRPGTLQRSHQRGHSRFCNSAGKEPHLDGRASLGAALCWFGSLSGFATDVLAACERAVALAPEDGGIRDSRGCGPRLDWRLPRVPSRTFNGLSNGGEKPQTRRTDASTSRLDPCVASAAEPLQCRTLATLAA